MAKRFIDAEKLNYLMCSIYWGEDEEGNEVYRQTEVAFRTDIEQIPTADVVEVVRGEWKYIQMDNFRQYKVICPFCEAEYVGNYDAYIEPYDFNYCPNCGAKLDEGR